MQGPRAEAWIDLYWLPLGAGGRFVRVNGKIYERLVALRQHRPARDIYHSALQVRLDGMTYAIEMGPVWNIDAVGPRGRLPWPRWRPLVGQVPRVPIRGPLLARRTHS